MAEKRSNGFLGEKIRQDMMVVGLKVVTDDVMELELQPLTMVKKKVSPMDLIGGSVDTLLQGIEKQRQHRDVIYVSRVWCSENNIVPFRSMVLSLELADKDRIHETYKR